MKVLIINTSERIGGAAIAANRLLKALNRNGIAAKMLVRDKQSQDPSVISLGSPRLNKWRFFWERFVIWRINKFNKQNLFALDIANTGTDITRFPEFREADIIHLHWINQGMLSLNDIRKILNTGKPVVWTLHDMWPFTGICHYADQCTKYRSFCHTCELLHDPGRKDTSYRIHRRKTQIFGTDARVTFVACSQWLENLAKSSSLCRNHRVTNIPNAIDTDLFRPLDRQSIRSELNLPTDKKLLLFGSMKITDKRKGIDYLVEACKILADKQAEFCRNLGVVVLGNQSEEYRTLFPFPIYPLNYVSLESKLADIYNATDLFVTPSLQDNLPNTIVEAMSCGIPCVGFDIGGIPQMIDHRLNGYLARYKSAEDLAQGIYWILQEANYESLCAEARKKATETYAEPIVARRYENIYRQTSERTESAVFE